MAFEFDPNSATPVDAGFDPSTAQPVKAAGAIRRVGDAGLALAKGVVGLPEAAVGVADLVTGGRAGKAVEDAGVRFKDAKDVLTGFQSDEQHAADAAVQEAGKEGFIPTLGAMVRNPSTIVNSTLESAPSMLGGAGVARGAIRALPYVAPRLAAGAAAAEAAPFVASPAARSAAVAVPIVAGALGEGVTAAGQNTEQVRQETPGGLLPEGAALPLAASGAITGAIGAASGGLANKLGLGEVNTMLAAGKVGPVGEKAIEKGASKGAIRRIGEGAVVEGGLQELPQSYQEQVAQNIAQGKPWDEGAAAAGAQGLLVGGAMGAGGAALAGKPHVAPPAGPPPGPISGALLQLPAPVVHVDTEGRAKMDGVPSGGFDSGQQEGVAGRAPIAAPAPAAAPAPLALPGPTVTVDSEGNARAPGQMPPAPEPGPRETGAVGRGRNSDTETARALPAPIVTVDEQGTAKTNTQRAEEAIAAQDARKAQAGDILNDSGRPFSGGIAANRAAKAAGAGYSVVKVEGGYAVRKGGDVTDVVAKEPTLSNVDAAAHQAAASPLNDKPEPTKAQILGGNAELGHARIGPLHLSIETPSGTFREDKQNTPPKWRTLMDGVHYGYIKRTVAADSTDAKRQGVDAFVKEGTPEDYAGPVFVIDQVNKDGTFDEHKALIGPQNELEARRTYLRQYEKGWKGLGAVTKFDSVSDFNTWAKNGKKTDPASPTIKPAAATATPVPASSSPTAAVSPAPVPAAGPAGASANADTSLKGAPNVTRPAEGAPGGGASAPAGQPGANRAEPAAVPGPANAAAPVARRDAGADGAATALPTDVLNEDGKPFRNRFAAGAALKKAGKGHEIAAVAEGGFVVRALPKTEAVPVETKPLSVGITPGNTEAVTVKDGIVHVGKNEAINFDTGEPIKVAAGATEAQIKQALKDGGALSKRQKFFGGKAEAVRPIGTEAPPAASSATSPVAAARAPRQVDQATTVPQPRYGRDGTPMSEGGQPFKNQLEAARFKKKHMRQARIVKGEGGGFVLRDPTDAELANGPKAGNRLQASLRAAEYEKNPLLAFMAKYGLYHEDGKRNSLKGDFSPDANPSVRGYGSIFRPDGLQLDELAIQAAQDGFLQRDVLEGKDRTRELSGLIERAIAGERIAPLHAEGQIEQEHAVQLERHKELQGLEPDDLDDTGYERANEEVQARVRELAAELEESGRDAETLLEEVAKLTENATEQTYYEHALRALEDLKATVASPGETGAADRGQSDGAQDGESQGEAEGLTAPTAADVVAQQDRAEASAKAEAKAKKESEQRAQADAERAEFTLTGSDRAADVAAAGGQQDLLAAPAEPAEPVASAPEAKLVEHTTGRGKLLKGYILNIGKDQARELDQYTFRKDGGFFVREAATDGMSAEVLNALAAGKTDAVPATEDAAPAPAVPAAPVEPPKPKHKAEALRAQGEKLVEQGQAEQGRDRNTNTHRRASMAASAEGKARATEAMGRTMINLADAIERGDAPALATITTKAQVESLDQALKSGMAERDRAEQKSYADTEREKGRPADTEDVKHARLPRASWDSGGASPGKLSAAINGKRGSREVAAMLQRTPSAELLAGLRKLGVSEKDISYGMGWWNIEAIGRLARFERMGIKTDADLRTALKQYIDLRDGPKAENPIKALERKLIGQKLGIDFFPTPKAAAERMVQEAGITEGMRVLEPSAGNGNIADAAKAAGAKVDVVEISSQLRDLLEAKGYDVVAHDFLEFTPTEKYDAVLMNPPFSNRLDAEHIQRAYDMLKPGGKLVAIAGEGVFFGSDKKAQAFRAWLDERGATVEKLPESTFKDTQLLATTGANARMVVIERGTEPAQFFKGASDGTMGRTAVQDAVSQITRDWLRKPQIEVIDSMADAPPAVAREYQRQQAQGGGGVVHGFHERGTVYVVADAVGSAADVQEVLFHESLGHFGLRGFFGDSLKPALSEIATNWSMKVSAKAKAYGLDMSKEGDRLMAAEEVLAELAQTRPELSIVQRVVAAIKTWLRERGLWNGEMSNEEVIAKFILPARGFVERGVNGKTTFSTGPTFSKKVSPLRPTSAEDKLAAMGYSVQQGYEDEPAWIEHQDGTMYDWNEDAKRFETEDGDPLPQEAADIAQYIGNVKDGIEDPEEITGVANDRNFVQFSKKAMPGPTNRQYTPEQLRAMQAVGFQVEVPTLKERAQALWQDAGKKLAQGIVDQFAPIKELSKEAYGLMRLAKGASGAFEAFLRGGKLKLSNGVYDFDNSQRGGVVDKLLIPLGGEHHDFFRWIAANRAERLAREGRENLFSAQDIADLKTLDTGVTAFDYTLQHAVHGNPAGTVTRDRTLIYRDALATFNEFNTNILDLAEQSGLIDGASRHLWEHEFYVPFYRVADDSNGGVRGMNIKGGVVRQQAFKALKGGKDALNADLLDNTLMNWSHLLDAAAKNRAAKATLEAAERMGVAIGAPQYTAGQIASATGNKNGVVWFMDGGQQRFFVVDDHYVLTAITAMEYAGMRNPVMNAMGAMKHALTIGVTASPFFKVRNLIRDSVQAIGTGPLSYNPGKNIAEGWKLTNPKSDAYFRLLAGGGTIHFGTMLEGSEAKRIQALVESGVDDATILNSDQKVKAFYRKFIEPGITAYNELGNRGEAINRAALYSQLRSQGMDHAEASLQARDLMDFSMQGSFTSIRFLTQVVPFFNARLQGLYKLGKAAKEDPARFGAVLGATALFSLGLLAAYHDDDDWKKREDWDRNNFWWFKFGGSAFRIPKPFEIGAIATLAERGAELAFEKEMTGKRFGAQVMNLLGDNLSFNPIPQLVKPIIDVYANKDSYTNRPIETMGMEHLKPEYRFTDRTSMVARGASTALNAAAGVVGTEAPSPVQIDHLLRGYFSWLGSFIVGAADTIARPATNQPSHPAPDYWKAVTGSMVSGLEDAPSRYVSQMYEQAKEIEQAYGTWRGLLKEGKTAEAEAFRQDNQIPLGRYHHVEQVKRQEARLNQQIKVVERSDLSPEEKRAKIRTLQGYKDAAARSMAPA